ncbi:crossover junction endodeoxyribonuclease RuvC [Magnetofaba australis]|uniref:crossover junction endodeoxyribonuclease RuvC n=1 Tax=Magnetofaba australis TaxID=1472297 RepID=UPI000A19E363
MRVLGIDPGSNVLGWGVVEGDGQRALHIAHGCVRQKSGAPLPDRLSRIFADLSEVIAEHKPHAVAVEEVFVSQNVRSALVLGHARGAAIVAAGAAALPVAEYTPMQIKKAVVGYGKADKKQVQEMMRMLLCLPKIPAQDAADALAVSLCHVNQAAWNQRANAAIAGIKLA